MVGSRFGFVLVFTTHLLTGRYIPVFNKRVGFGLSRFRDIVVKIRASPVQFS